jgi:hypothetical protein
MNFVAALKLYCKEHGGEWSIGETFESLEWLKDEFPKPTIEQLEEYHEQYLQEQENTEYKRLRAAAYPSIQDQLDLIQREGLEGWSRMIQAIKEKYPNPLKGVIQGAAMSKTEMQLQIESLNEKVDVLTSKVDVNQMNSKDIQLITDEIKAGMFAIKGFMMEIPNIQKQLNIIQEQIGGKDANG